MKQPPSKSQEMPREMRRRLAIAHDWLRNGRPQHNFSTKESTTKKHYAIPSK
ncbi:hypothetical protein R6258_07735 [Halomonas sp. HP20-15]|uniref:hypothetical protein n=1 Tax=Halomonas sp. HP20-15 TaxID=3085901 RepID=UPI002980D447|nr:hypothetical protein [Halomonas sp. HP20-15]MDW5376810.1 hypothetical protein [Halomonas sp. HP20-15]